jgi:hypothetical protein
VESPAYGRIWADGSTDLLPIPEAHPDATRGRGCCSLAQATREAWVQPGTCPHGSERSSWCETYQLRPVVLWPYRSRRRLAGDRSPAYGYGIGRQWSSPWSGAREHLFVSVDPAA